MIDAGRVPVLGELVTAADVLATWDALDLDRRRAAVDTLMTLTLLPPGRGARTFNPETVRIDWRAAPRAAPSARRTRRRRTAPRSREAAGRGRGLAGVRDGAGPARRGIAADA